MAEIERTWVEAAVAKIDADFTRSADTHLLKVELPATFGISVYLKDESIHPTGSLKHRLARSLFLYAPQCRPHTRTLRFSGSAGQAV
jgi:cysteine synthase